MGGKPAVTPNAAQTPGATPIPPAQNPSTSPTQNPTGTPGQTPANPAQNPAGGTAQAPATGEQAVPQPGAGSAAPPNPADFKTPDALGKQQPEFHAGKVDLWDPNGGIIAGNGVEITYQGTTVTADRVTGNLNRELVMTGHAKIVAHGVSSLADAIHVYPRTRTFRLDNPRAVVDPSLLQGQVTDPLNVTGGSFNGSNTGYSFADYITATTCIEDQHHYEMRIKHAELFPYDKLVMKQVSFYLFGVKLLTVPSLTIPLDLNQRARRPRSDYLPEIGQNDQEGYYVRIPYAFSESKSAGTFVRLDITQKRGQGYRFEQDYLAGKQVSAFNTAGVPTQGGFTGATSGSIANAYGYGNVQGLPGLGTGLGPQNGGLFAMQGYFGYGFNKLFNATYKHQQGIGGSNRLGFTTELQNDSLYVGSNQSAQNTRFTFDHNDTAHGSQANLALGLNTTDLSGSPSSGTSVITGSLHQSFDFDSRGSNSNKISYSFDLNRTLNTTGATDTTSALSNRSALLNSDIQMQHLSRDYSFSFEANKTSPIGPQSGNGNFGSLEKLPELKFASDTLNYKGGWLRYIPLHLDLGVGRYSEPSHNFTNDRFLLGFTLQETAIMRGRTEITTGGGFEQRLYSDSAAQYIMRNTTRLRQHLGGRSGIDLTYNYEQPEGGTPFLFDTFGKSHNLVAEAGYLDDRHFQFTARVGYDFLGTLPGLQAMPFQTLSMRTMYRPNDHLRYDALATYDPNTGKFLSFANSVKIRARNDCAIDFIGRYDPTTHKFSQLNTQFDIPIGRTWRLQGLWLYNGITKTFDSRNLQILHEWDCMEASVTYSETPLGFGTGSSRQFYFTLRLKSIPFFRSFARGPAGQALSTGIGDLY